MAQKMPRNECLHERRHKRQAGPHGPAGRTPMSTPDSIKDQTEGILDPSDDDSRAFPNRFRCRRCGTLCVSRFRHDFASCSCGNFVDGGNDYRRAGGNANDMDFECSSQRLNSKDECQLKGEGK